MDVANTPIKCFRIPQETYKAAQERAEQQGDSLTEIVRAALESYAKTGKKPKRPR